MTAIHRLVASCISGENNRCIGKLKSGWVVMGESQFLPGYCLLLPDPVVPHLNEMTANHQADFLAEMAAVGNAVLKSTGAVRINYAMFGNQEPALHAHIIPRYETEKEGLKTATPWSYDWANAEQFSTESHGELLLQIKRELGLLT